MASKLVGMHAYVFEPLCIILTLKAELPLNIRENTFLFSKSFHPGKGTVEKTCSKLKLKLPLLVTYFAVQPSG